MKKIIIDRYSVSTIDENTVIIDEYFGNFKSKIEEYLEKGYKPVKVMKDAKGKLYQVTLVKLIN